MDLSGGDVCFDHTHLTLENHKETTKKFNEYQQNLDTIKKDLNVQELKVIELDKKREALHSKIINLEQELIHEKEKYRQEIDDLILKQMKIPFESKAFSSEASFNLISGGKGTAQEKLAVMEECGIKVTKNPAEMGRLLKSVLG